MSSQTDDTGTPRLNHFNHRAGSQAEFMKAMNVLGFPDQFTDFGKLASGQEPQWNRFFGEIKSNHGIDTQSQVRVLIVAIVEHKYKYLPRRKRKSGKE
jgi:hypothetical protein